jgi:hypothetical protein
LDAQVGMGWIDPLPFPLSGAVQLFF